MVKISKARWAKVLVVEKMLCANHPKAFIPFGGRADAVYPLKVGIGKDILQLYPELDGAVFSSFMKHYVTLPRYLKITGRVGMPRVDLDGNVVSVISEQQASNALRFLETRTNSWTRASSKPSATTEDKCRFTGKIKFKSAFEADQAMIRTHQRSRATSATAGHSFKCRCGSYHWGRE